MIARACTHERQNRLIAATDFRRAQTPEGRPAGRVNAEDCAQHSRESQQRRRPDGPAAEAGHDVRSPGLVSQVRYTGYLYTGQPRRGLCVEVRAGQHLYRRDFRAPETKRGCKCSA